MRIAIACDHAGYLLKQIVLEAVSVDNDEILDLGTDSPSPVDYPDYVEKLGHAIQASQVDRGILVCGSGIGACITANKMKGIYAGLCHDTYSARQGVEHDNMNVLCLGARVIGPELAKEIIRSFLAANFSNEERHVRRLTKMRKLEENG